MIWIMSLLFLASFVINLILVWYVRRVIKNFFFLEANVRVLLKNVEDYTEHLEQINEMHMYYGDATIENLIRHTKAVSTEIKEFSKAFFSSDGDSFDAEEKESDEE